MPCQMTDPQPGQAQGPLIHPIPPLVPTGRPGAPIPRFARHNSSGRYGMMRAFKVTKEKEEMDSANTATSETKLLQTLSNQMADAVERVEPALVLVNGRPRQPASGIVYAQNLVLTADHVLEREEDLTIQTHDKRTLAAQFVGRDLATDLAVWRIADLGLEKAPLASEAARVGQLVMAVGRSPSEGTMASI